MPIDPRNVRGLIRSIAYDARGSRLGRVAQVFLDDRTDEPAWVAVDVTRTRGMRLLPLAGAGLKGRHLVIRSERAAVRSAPRVDLADGQLTSMDESRLLEHYGLTPNTDAQPDPGPQRPASPWPDDTERETAWEQPARTQPQSRVAPGVPEPAPAAPAPASAPAPATAPAPAPAPAPATPVSSEPPPGTVTAGRRAAAEGWGEPVAPPASAPGGGSKGSSPTR